jgi:hypothetical protein
VATLVHYSLYAPRYYDIACTDTLYYSQQQDILPSNALPFDSGLSVFSNTNTTEQRLEQPLPILQMPPVRVAKSLLKDIANKPGNQSINKISGDFAVVNFFKQKT